MMTDDDIDISLLRNIEDVQDTFNNIILSIKNHTGINNINLPLIHIFNNDTGSHFKNDYIIKIDKSNKVFLPMILLKEAFKCFIPSKFLV